MPVNNKSIRCGEPVSYTTNPLDDDNNINDLNFDCTLHVIITGHADFYKLKFQTFEFIAIMWNN